MNQKQILAGSAIKKLRSGERITDEELDAAIPVVEFMCNSLLAMGEAYYLAYSNLHIKLEMLRDFQFARRRDATT